jgi:hypothetical protein
MTLADAMMEVMFLSGVNFSAGIDVTNEDWTTSDGMSQGTLFMLDMPLAPTSAFANFTDARNHAIAQGYISDGSGFPAWLEITSQTRWGRLVEIRLEADATHPAFRGYREWFYETFGYRSSVAIRLPYGVDSYDITIELVNNRFSKLEVVRVQPMFGISFLEIDVPVFTLEVFYYGPNMQREIPRFDHGVNSSWNEFGNPVTWGEPLPMSEFPVLTNQRRVVGGLFNV